MNQNEEVTLNVRTQLEPTRLDVYLAAAIEGLSRKQAQRMIQQGFILVDERTASKGLSLQGGERIRIVEPIEPEDWTAAPNGALPLKVVHEDSHLLVINKPSGLPSTPLRSDETNTLAGALVARYPECAPLQTSRGDGGLVQRLDTETSGLMIAARSQEIFHQLIDQQRQGAIVKSYLALVSRRENQQPPERIEIPLGSARSDGSKVGRLETGRPLLTTTTIEREFRDWYLVRASIHRGFRHQIRAHLALEGFPLAGDRLYDGPQIDNLNRLFLHAAEIEMPHPVTNERVCWQANLPKKLVAILDSLEP